MIWFGLLVRIGLIWFVSVAVAVAVAVRCPVVTSTELGEGKLVIMYPERRTLSTYEAITWMDEVAPFGRAVMSVLQPSVRQSSKLQFPVRSDESQELGASSTGLRLPGERTVTPPIPVRSALGLVVVPVRIQPQSQRRRFPDCLSLSWTALWPLQVGTVP